MSTDHADINRHIRVYLMIFAALLVLTGLTVAAWKWGPEAIGPTIALALLIATVKASLVALFFMHLSAEKKLIYWVLAITVVFFFVLLFVPILTASDLISL